MQEVGLPWELDQQPVPGSRPVLEAQSQAPGASSVRQGRVGPESASEVPVDSS